MGECIEDVDAAVVPARGEQARTRDVATCGNGAAHYCSCAKGVRARRWHLVIIVAVSNRLSGNRPVQHYLLKRSHNTYTTTQPHTTTCTCHTSAPLLASQTLTAPSFSAVTRRCSASACRKNETVDNAFKGWRHDKQELQSR